MPRWRFPSSRESLCPERGMIPAGRAARSPSRRQPARPQRHRRRRTFQRRHRSRVGVHCVGHPPAWRRECRPRVRRSMIRNRRSPSHSPSGRHPRSSSAGHLARALPPLPWSPRTLEPLKSRLAPFAIGTSRGASPSRCADPVTLPIGAIEFLTLTYQSSSEHPWKEPSFCAAMVLRDKVSLPGTRKDSGARATFAFLRALP